MDFSKGEAYGSILIPITINLYQKLFLKTKPGQ